MATSLPHSSRMDFNNLALEAKDLDLTGNLSVAGTTSSTGNQTFAGNVAITGTLGVTGAATLGTLNVTSIVKSTQLSVPIMGQAKVGATAGWVITAGTDKSHATLPASQTASTLVIPFPALPVGSTVTAVGVGGQVESAGNNVTLTMSVRKQTNAAADNADAELSGGSDNVGTLTADTILSAANLGVTGLSEVIAADESLYVLLTGTTAASTDIDVTHLLITFTSV